MLTRCHLHISFFPILPPLIPLPHQTVILNFCWRCGRRFDQILGILPGASRIPARRVSLWIVISKSLSNLLRIPLVRKSHSSMLSVWWPRTDSMSLIPNKPSKVFRRALGLRLWGRPFRSRSFAEPPPLWLWWYVSVTRQGQGDQGRRGAAGLPGRRGRYEGGALGGGRGRGLEEPRTVYMYTGRWMKNRRKECEQGDYICMGPNKFPNETRTRSGPTLKGQNQRGCDISGGGAVSMLVCFHIRRGMVAVGAW
ncbi:hypothetical protein BGX38DRAFT_52665 [Terfezia claveryi]|nr:hypothetical protein BGX38DRAFT_52665 [Terfezia claveryi]